MLRAARRIARAGGHPPAGGRAGDGLSRARRLPIPPNRATLTPGRFPDAHAGETAARTGGRRARPGRPLTEEEHVKRQVISTDKGPRTGLPYSQGIRHGDLVYVAGQVALDPATGQVVAGGIREQTRQVLQNVEAILQAAGTSLAHSVECLCLLSTSATSRRSTRSTRPSSRRTRRRARRSRRCSRGRGSWSRSGPSPRCRRPAPPRAPGSRPAARPRSAAAGSSRQTRTPPPGSAERRARGDVRQARVSRRRSRQEPRRRPEAVRCPSGRGPRAARGGSAASARGAPSPRRRARRGAPRAPRSPGRR